EPARRGVARRRLTATSASLPPADAQPDPGPVMSLRLTIVGSAGTNPSAERVCSCYLVEADGFRLVLDLGHGALHRLQQVIDVAEIDALLLSHLHADHFADIYGLNY